MPSSRLSPVRRRLPLYLSACAHGFALLVFVPVSMRMKQQPAPAADEYQIAMIEVAGGSRAAKLPMLAPDGIQKDKQQPESRPAEDNLLHKRRLPKLSGSQAQAARLQDQGTGPAAGNGSDARDATPAFPTFFPKPPVTDRGLLPLSDRQVVIDVKLSATGEVLSETLVRGMGNPLDQIALMTAKSWRFQPATVNGQPVAPEAEVIFTFGPHYPII